MNAWQAALKRCLRDVVTANKPKTEGKTAWSHDKDENDREGIGDLVSDDTAHILMNQPISKNAILHYDDFEESAVVFFCPVERGLWEEHIDFSADGFSDCRKMCEFSL